MGLAPDLSDGRARLLEAALRTCQGVGLGPATQDGGADPNTRRCSAHLRKAWAQKGGLSGRRPGMSMIRQLSPARAFRKVRHVGAPYRREAYDRAKAGSGSRWMNAAPSNLTPEVRKAMLGALPSLRAFAMSLAHSPDHADDLVQEAIVRALTNIETFEPGTNMSAWLFRILRNLFYSQHRRAKHEVPDPDGSYAGQLRTAPEQSARCDFQDLRRALARLSVEHQEALILIGAAGLSYEEAAQVCGVAIGTMKSRVHRGRVHLAELLGVTSADELGPDRVMQAALQPAI